MQLSKLSVFLTGVDLKEGSNGLGPNRWGYWRMFFPYQCRFYEAALNHDIYFSIGGNIEDFRLANEVFYAECRAKSKSKIQKLFANLYYFLVKSYGHKYFNFK